MWTSRPPDNGGTPTVTLYILAELIYNVSDSCRHAKPNSNALFGFAIPRNGPRRPGGHNFTPGTSQCKVESVSLPDHLRGFKKMVSFTWVCI